MSFYAHRRVRLLAVLIVLAVASTGVVEAPGTPHDGRIDAVIVDTDEDGLSDVEESAGWSTRSNGVFETDPTLADTDGDGLSDGQEAGASDFNPAWGGLAYRGESNPTNWDSDGDGLDDASEVDGGFGTWVSDSDSDGLDDLEEIEFGSNPLIPNSDGDHLDDRAERDEGSNPDFYDLTAAQGAKALAVGAAVGSWEWGARHLPLVSLDEAQITSWQYLVGSVARGYVPGADLTDVIADLGGGNWNAALISLVALVPLLGDSAKTTDSALAFARRGNRATHSAMQLFDRLPGFSETTKSKAVRSLVRQSPKAARLPQDLAVRGKQAPQALGLARPISKDAAQNEAKDKLIAEMVEEGYTDFRVNQRQVDVDGMVVGINRPDVQATAPDGTRINIEFDTNASARGPAHRTRILSNDDTADVCLRTERTGYLTCDS